MSTENCDSACERGCDGDHGMSLSQENRRLWSKTQRLEAELVAARATIAQLGREKSLALRQLATLRPPAFAWAVTVTQTVGYVAAGTSIVDYTAR